MPHINLPPKFVARKKEFELLKEKLEKTMQGVGSTLLIAGESGVGKTRLVEELIEVAEENGYQVFKAKCFLESLAPYAPMAELLKEAGLEHLLTETKPPKIEGIYCVKKGGIIIAKYERKETMDSDIFMGMVTAVETFVKDSIAQMQQSYVAEQIGHMGYGNFHIVNVPGKLLNLVAVTTGRENEYLISDLREILEDIEKGLCGGLETIEASQIAAIEDKLKTLFLRGKYEGVDYAEEDAKIRQANLFENVTRGLQRKAEQKPVLIFIDDLQWSDPSSLAMLHYIARNTRKNAVLIVGTYRIEEIVAKHDEKRHPLVEAMEKMEKEELLEKVELKRLDKEVCHALICSVLGTEIAQEFTEKIYRETEGNTFFVVEILKNLYEEKQLYLEGGKWHYHLDTLQIPKKVYEIVLRRIERLAKEERDLLDAASILGEEFTSQMVAKLTELPYIQVVKMLVSVERAHKLIRALKSKYKFEHGKIREVLYAEMADELRKIYHEIAGQILEENYKAGNADVLADVVYHYSKAMRSDKVIEYGLSAGKLAKKRFANEESIRFYKAVLEAMKEEEGYKELKLQVLGEIAEVLELTGRYDEALEILKIRISALITEKPLEAGKSYRKRCEIYIQKGDYENAIVEAEQAEQVLSETTKSELELARVWSAKGLIYERKGDYKSAIEAQEKAEQVFKKARVEKELGNVIHRMGTCYLYLGEYDKALQLFTDALRIREKISDLRGIAGSYNNIAIVYHEKGENEKALEFHKKSLELVEKIGDVRGISAGYNNIAIAYGESGELEKALEFHKKSLEVKEKIGDVWGIAMSYNNAGSIYYMRGHYEKALELYNKSLELRKKIGDVWGMSINYFNIGMIHYELGEFHKGLEALQKALEIAKEVKDKSEICKSLLGIARCYVGMGNFESANEMLREAKKFVVELAAKPIDAEFLSVSGILLASEGKIAEAELELKKAIDMYETVGRLDIEYYKILFELGKVKNEKELLMETLTFFEKIENRAWIERVKKEIEKV
ncbi:MAG: tetratricopeptide repeat protein [Thermoplasmata archaeon]